MPGRQFNSNSYRYGMNTQEKDIEVGEGIYTAQFWEYDSRLGRRWNIDPVVHPWESPYACFANNPVWFSDVNGDEATSKGDPPAKKGVPIILDNGHTYVPSVDEAIVKPPSLIERGANYLNRLFSAIGKTSLAIIQGKFHIWGTGSGGEGTKNQQDVTKLKRKAVEGMVMIDMGDGMEVLDPLNTKPLGGNGKEARDKVKDDEKEEVISGSPDVANGLSDGATQTVLKRATKDTVIKQTTQGMADTLYLIYSLDEYKEKGTLAEPKRVELGKGKKNIIEINN
jgi:hypothetical protein